ncbi:hypothetical protein L208DRAFT_1377551 [Tricholoma matsutake]|nr:hypothetical protein L208DRAFT_1377551 [Tricholoma matsutake 945]
MSGSVWRYKMRTHLTKYHPSIHDTDILKAYIISKSEKAALKLRWDKCHKDKLHQKWHNIISTPLTISEVHSLHQALFCASTTWPLSTPNNTASLDTLQLGEAEVLNEHEAEETNSESETDSEADKDSEEMEMAEQYAGEEEDETKPNSCEEDHIPTSIFLTLPHQMSRNLKQHWRSTWQ